MNKAIEVSPVRVGVNTLEAWERPSLVMGVELLRSPADGEGLRKNRARHCLGVPHAVSEKKGIQQSPGRVLLRRHRFSGPLYAQNRREHISARGNQVLSSKNPSGGDVNIRSDDHVHPLCRLWA